ncbi:MAG: ZIP family metal transporter [Patescibacteria group bacterium]
MSEVWIYSLLSVFFVSLISLIGILTLSIKVNLLKKVLIYLVSFAAGTLLGDAFLHLLPEVVEKNGLTLEISLTLLGGIILFFSLEKLVYWHHYHMPFGGSHVHPFAIMNLVGDGFHNFLDGLIIGASYLISIPVGIATTSAVAFHEIPQEIGEFGVLINGGFSKTRALVMNFLSALMAVIGAIVSLTLNSYTENLEFFIIPLAIGGFVYIAGSDLIPELHKHPKIKESLLQLAIIIAGILVMAVLLLLE